MIESAEPVRVRHAMVFDVEGPTHDGAWTVAILYDGGGWPPEEDVEVSEGEWTDAYWPPRIGDIVRVIDEPRVKPVRRPRRQP